MTHLAGSPNFPSKFSSNSSQQSLITEEDRNNRFLRLGPSYSTQTSTTQTKSRDNSKTNTESAKHQFHVIIQCNYHLLDSTTIFFRKRIYILSIQHFRWVSNYFITCCSSTTLFWFTTTFTTTPNNASNKHNSNTNKQIDISVKINNLDNISNRTSNRTNINLSSTIDSRTNRPTNNYITSDNFITTNTPTNTSITSDNFI